MTPDFGRKKSAQTEQLHFVHSETPMQEVEIHQEDGIDEPGLRESPRQQMASPLRTGQMGM